MGEKSRQLIGGAGARVSAWWRLHPNKVLLSGLTFLFLVSAYLFVELADEVTDGQTHQLDEWCLRSFRQPDDPALPIGPSWMREAFLDATALGSPMILGMTVVAAVGYLAMQGRFRLALATVVATGGGGILVLILKYLIGRPRPSVVPHLREVTTPGFPSGHAMASAVVFLTIGVILAHSVASPRAKAYILLWASFLSFIVGVSRVYLGVHYPTDVLGGWIAAFGWALFVWLVFPKPTNSGKSIPSGPPGS